MEYEKIWQKVLSPGEEIKYEFTVGQRYCYGAAVGSVIFSVLLGIAFIPLGIIFLILGPYISLVILKKSNAFAFTNKRVLIHQGLFSTKLTSVDYDRITDIHVVEPYAERITYRTGSLAINTAGSAGIEIVLRHIASPYEVKKKLDEIRTSK